MKRGTPRPARVGDMAYRIRCTSCHYGKNFGAGQSAANRGGARHVQRMPQHVVALIRETTIAVFSGVDGVDVLA